ncbi:MAG: ABC transporter related protein [Synergistales bacterium 58_81]|nr:MAG: ABC transporter related protein [Synergistales bacterium 58_81]
MNSLTPVLTVGYQISEVLQVRQGLSRGEAEKRTLELLAMTNLTPVHARRFPHELSGGEKQRAVISMALSCSPDLLIADEPTSALDVITQAEVITTLVRMVRDQGMGLLLVTHDLPLAISVCDDLAVMHEGRIVETGTPSKILRYPSHEHTRKLLSAFIFKGGART